MSAAGLTCLAAIPLMPIGDLIVLSFTSPVFAVFFEFLLLGRRIKVTTVGLCCLIGEISQNIQLSVVHLDVEDFSEELLQCLLCHKEPARRIQRPLLGAPRWFFMA